MAADVALDPELMALYPFCRLTGPANVLIMPALHSANIASKLLQQLGGGTVIGPLLVGLSKPVQIVPMNATVSRHPQHRRDRRLRGDRRRAGGTGQPRLPPSSVARPPPPSASAPARPA